jgi:hypothetical protein
MATSPRSEISFENDRLSLRELEVFIFIYIKELENLIKT